MEIRKRLEKDVVVLYVSGSVDINSAQFIEETGHTIKQGLSKILCNFTNLERVDYQGLSILTIAYKNIINQGGTLKFCKVPSHIKELFKNAQLDEVFEMYPDEETAIQSYELTTKVDKMSMRRRFKRIDINASIRYKLGVSTKETFYTGKILNLSGEGLYVHCQKTFPISTELYMELKLGNEKTSINMMGTVAWLADKELQLHAYPGMGIKFTNLDQKFQKILIDFIETNITRRSKV